MSLIIASNFLHSKKKLWRPLKVETALILIWKWQGWKYWLGEVHLGRYTAIDVHNVISRRICIYVGEKECFTGQLRKQRFYYSMGYFCKFSGCFNCSKILFFKNSKIMCLRGASDFKENRTGARIMYTAHIFYFIIFTSSCPHLYVCLGIESNSLYCSTWRVFPVFRDNNRSLH